MCWILMLTPFIIDRAVIFNDGSQNKKLDVIYIGFELVL